MIPEEWVASLPTLPGLAWGERKASMSRLEEIMDATKEREGPEAMALLAAVAGLATFIRCAKITGNPMLDKISQLAAMDFLGALAHRVGVREEDVFVVVKAADKDVAR